MAGDLRAQPTGRRLGASTIARVAEEGVRRASAAPLERVPSGVLVVGAIGSVQIGTALAATIFADVGPAGAVTLRILFGALILLVAWRPSLRGHTRADVALIAAFGLVLGAMNLSFYAAVQRIPLGIAVALELIGPLTVALLGSRRRVDLAWIALAAAGVLLLTHTSGRSLDGLGVALALLAGACWGTYIVLNARLGRTAQRGSLALAMCCALVAVLPFGVVQAGSSLLSSEALAIGLLVGLLSTAIPYSLELEALRRIETHVFGVLMSLEPAAAALAGLVVLGQHLGPREVLGIVLVMAASVGASRAGEEAPLAL